MFKLKIVIALLMVSSLVQAQCIYDGKKRNRFDLEFVTPSPDKTSRIIQHMFYKPRRGADENYVQLNFKLKLMQNGRFCNDFNGTVVGKIARRIKKDQVSRNGKPFRVLPNDESRLNQKNISIVNGEINVQWKFREFVYTVQRFFFIPQGAKPITCEHRSMRNCQSTYLRFKQNTSSNKKHVTSAEAIVYPPFLWFYRPTESSYKIDSVLIKDKIDVLFQDEPFGLKGKIYVRGFEGRALQGRYFSEDGRKVRTMMVENNFPSNYPLKIGKGLCEDIATHLNSFIPYKFTFSHKKKSKLKASLPEKIDLVFQDIHVQKSFCEYTFTSNSSPTMVFKKTQGQISEPFQPEIDFAPYALRVMKKNGNNVKLSGKVVQGIKPKKRNKNSFFDYSSENVAPNVYYGHLELQEATISSEMEQVSVPLELQVYKNGGFQTLTTALNDDKAVQDIPLNQISSKLLQPNNFQLINDVSAQNLLINQGNGTIEFSKSEGAPHPNVLFEIILDEYPWLKDYWDKNSDELKNPTKEIKLGVFQKRERVISWREI